MTAPSVRVVILNYNQPEMTARCVRTVLEQDCDSLEVVVVDNASTAESYRLLSRLLPGNVALVRSETNRGYAAGNNVGMRFQGESPKPDYYLILNNDAELKDPATILILIRALQSDRDAVAVSPLINDPDRGNPHHTIQVRRVPDFWTTLVAGSWWLRRLPVFRQYVDSYVYRECIPWEQNKIYASETINGACFLVRRDFMDSIGLLDEGTFLYYEELILGAQIKLRNKKCLLATSTRVDHYQGSSTSHTPWRFNTGMFREQVRSELYYCRRYLKVTKPLIWLVLCIREIDLLTKRLALGLLGRVARTS